MAIAEAQQCAFHVDRERDRGTGADLLDVHIAAMAAHTSGEDRLHYRCHADSADYWPYRYFDVRAKHDGLAIPDFAEHRAGPIEEVLQVKEHGPIAHVADRVTCLLNNAHGQSITGLRALHKDRPGDWISVVTPLSYRQQIFGRCVFGNARETTTRVFGLDQKDL